ncbi:MAG: hypothetical protein RIT81_25515 [Deltaproteobacteria bacterium]
MSSVASTLLALVVAQAPTAEASPEEDQTVRGLEEQLILRLDATADFALTTAEGTNAAGVEIPPDTLRDSTNFVIGDLRIGSRGLLYQPLSTYAMATGGLNLAGAPATVALEEVIANDAAVHPTIYDPYGGQQVFLRLAYAELDGLTERGALSQIYVRAGRQFHWGVAPVTFDGATLAFDSGLLRASGWFGQRAGVFEAFQPSPGIVGGASAHLDFDDLDVPLLIRAEYTFARRSIALDPRDTANLGLNELTATSHLGRVSAFYDVTRDLLLQARVDTLDQDITRARLGVRYLNVLGALSVDLDQKIGEEAIYAVSGMRTITVRDQRTQLARPAVVEAFRLGMTDRSAYTHLDARFAIEILPWLEIEPTGVAHVVYGDPDTLTPWDASFYGLGLGVYSRHRLDDSAGLEVDFRYDGRLYDRDVDGLGLYTDAGAGPEKLANEFTLGVSYALATRAVGKRMLQRRWLKLGVAGTVLLYDLATPHEDDIGQDSMFGASASAEWVPNDYVSLALRYEMAVDSSLFLPELGAIHELFLRTRFVF